MKHPVMQPKKLSHGFTLLEVLIATTVFALSVLALIKIGSDSIRAVRDSQGLFDAVQLAQSKMNEMELKFQRQIDRDGVKEKVMAEESGTFEAPYSDYKWEAILKESSMKLNAASLRALFKNFGLEEEVINEQLEDPSQKLVFGNINKSIKENYAELIVTVRWERFGRKYNMPLITHLIPTTPKITLSTNSNDFESGSEDVGAAGGEGAGADKAGTATPEAAGGQ